MTNDLIFIRDVLYDLKRRYGTCIDLYEPNVEAPNLTTGKKKVSYNKYRIKQAIHVPAGFQTLAQYSQAYLKSAGRAFAFGAYVDQDIRNLLIDGADLPKGIEILPNWQIIIDHKRFEVWKLNKTEGNYAYLVSLKRVEGNRPEEIHTLIIRQSIRFTQVGDTT